MPKSDTEHNTHTFEHLVRLKLQNLALDTGDIHLGEATREISAVFLKLHEVLNEAHGEEATQKLLQEALRRVQRESGIRNRD
ncbi:hypothetical protein [Deinococcus cellulosilyticus]|uniref:Uncharacterized protein n=1 Tax=Deinococcus cellulosilyticus (strain DSM 18568 / NBRC 106333 / KACC 11606 / 5516J-15) TaxID=1223518 RepID=A0A511N8C1_DEIC1|nr:hypothetical protein [Deinococcus cellulosilyticus]GEM48681.1 hypothetical protein DC3_43160 [Deinococcus cellulosilyticus NBRC 106333 = KACC 11606]